MYQDNTYDEVIQKEVNQFSSGMKAPTPPLASRKRWFSICNNVIDGVSSLKRHMVEHHKVGKRPDILCESCGKKYPRNQSLRAHSCQGDKAQFPFSFDVCEKVFPS